LRSFERWEYLHRAPGIAWDLLTKRRYAFTFDWMSMVVEGLSAGACVNLLRSGLNLGYRRPRAWSWPVNMQVELTSYCNLRCPVCPAGAGTLTRAPQAMEPRLFERLMEEAGPYLLTLALWAWGEPLLHPQLERMLAVTRRYPVVTLLSTNGQNLNQDRVQEALQNEPPGYLIVAIDGLCDKTNSLYRKGAKLATALEGVRALAEWKSRTGARLPVLHCRFMVMRHNEHELPGLREFAADARFDSASIRTLSIVESLEEAHQELIPEAESLRAYTYRDGSRERRGDFVCQHAFTYPTVLADGTVVACEQDFNGVHAFGRISPETSFASIWFGEKAAGIRRVIRDDPEQLSFCRSCPFADRATSSCSIAAIEGLS
jgi:radical SAM protein with 4Fe4S-binding SPASM domain